MTTATTTTPDVIDPAPKDLARVVRENQLPAVDGQALIASFSCYFADAQALVDEAKALTVTDPTQVTEIKKSRDMRLKLRQVRIAAEKTRKALKEDSLRKGKAIDGIYNVLALLIEPEERRLEDQEKIAERMEAQRKQALQASRAAELAPYGVDTRFFQLGDMPEADYQTLLANSRNAHENRLAAEKRAREEAEAAERARQEEAARLRAENERLQREKEAAEAAARAEREKAEAERRAAEEAARAEREAADKARREAEAKAQREREEAEAVARAEREELEAQARKEREAREKLEREAAEREAAAEAERKRAALAPDKDKLRAWAAALRAVPVPECTTATGAQAAREVETFLATVFERIEKLAERLGGAA